MGPRARQASLSKVDPTAQPALGRSTTPELQFPESSRTPFPLAVPGAAWMDRAVIIYHDSGYVVTAYPSLFIKYPCINR